MRFEGRDAAKTLPGGIARPARRPGLTALVDVVFLLLIFFMLASSLTREQALTLRVAETAVATTSERETLRIELFGDGSAALDGRAVESAALPAALGDVLASRLRSGREASVSLHPEDEVGLQRIARVLEDARDAGALEVTLARPRP